MVIVARYKARHNVVLVGTDKFWHASLALIHLVKANIAVGLPFPCYIVTSLSIHTMLSFCTDVMVLVDWDDPSSMICVRCLPYPPPCHDLRRFARAAYLPSVLYL